MAQLDVAVARRLAAGLSRPAPRRPGPRPRPPPPASAPASALSALTERETDVLRLTAGRLFLSEGTVKNHISRVLSRPGLHDRTHAASYARDHGLLQAVRPA